jgi:hypothetical protein
MPLRLAGDNFVPVRGDTQIVQAPDASNDYTLILEFDDTVQPGAGLLPVKIIIEPMLGSRVGETPFALRRDHPLS